MTALALCGAGAVGVWAQAAPAVTAPAPDAATMAVANQLSEWLWPRAEWQAALAKIDAEARTLGPHPTPHPELNALLEKQAQIIATTEHNRWQANIDAMASAHAKALARVYTPDELRALLAFSQSPAGRDFMARVQEIDHDDAVSKARFALAIGGLNDLLAQAKAFAAERDALIKAHPEWAAQDEALRKRAGTDKQVPPAPVRPAPAPRACACPNSPPSPARQPALRGRHYQI